MNTKSILLKYFISSALLLLSLFITAQTNTIYVAPAPNGSDDNGDGSSMNPYASLQKAWDMASPGTTIDMKEGIYAPDCPINLTLNNYCECTTFLRGSVSPKENITIEGNGSIIDLSNFYNQEKAIPAVCLDCDNDGCRNIDDDCPWTPKEPVEGENPCYDQPECSDDIDLDGIPDKEDNCELAPNPDQTDSDGDKVGDACEISEYGKTTLNLVGLQIQGNEVDTLKNLTINNLKIVGGFDPFVEQGARQYGIRAQLLQNCTFNGLDMSGVNGDCFALFESDGCVIKNSKFYSNKAHDEYGAEVNSGGNGFVWENVHNTVLIYNEAWDNNDEGFDLKNGDSNTNNIAAFNRSFNNGRNGFELGINNENLILYRNVMYNNGNGVGITGGKYPHYIISNTVYGSTINGFTFGCDGCGQHVAINNAAYDSVEDLKNSEVDDDGDIFIKTCRNSFSLRCNESMLTTLDLTDQDFHSLNEHDANFLAPSCISQLSTQETYNCLDPMAENPYNLPDDIINLIDSLGSTIPTHFIGALEPVEIADCVFCGDDFSFDFNIIELNNRLIIPNLDQLINEEGDNAVFGFEWFYEFDEACTSNTSSIEKCGPGTYCVRIYGNGDSNCYIDKCYVVEDRTCEYTENDDNIENNPDCNPSGFEAPQCLPENEMDDCNNNGIPDSVDCACAGKDVCDPNLADVDCDGNGVSNSHECECEEIKDQAKMAKMTVCEYLSELKPGDPILDLDCNGNKITNIQECQNGDDPLACLNPINPNSEGYIRFNIQFDDCASDQQLRYEWNPPIDIASNRCSAAALPAGEYCVTITSLTCEECILVKCFDLTQESNCIDLTEVEIMVTPIILGCSTGSISITNTPSLFGSSDNIYWVDMPEITSYTRNDITTPGTYCLRLRLDKFCWHDVCVEVGVEERYEFVSTPQIICVDDTGNEREISPGSASLINPLNGEIIKSISDLEAGLFCFDDIDGTNCSVCGVIALEIRDGGITGRDCEIEEKDDDSRGRSIIKSKEVVHVVPNPTSDLLYISGVDVNSDLNYQVFDLIGRMVKKGRITTESLSMGELNNGVYILHLTDRQSENILSKRVIKL